MHGHRLVTIASVGLIRGSLGFSRGPRLAARLSSVTGNDDAQSSVTGKGTASPHLFKGSAFTGKADFYEALFFLQDIKKRAQAVSSLHAGGTISSLGPSIPIPWYAQDAMAERMGFALTKLQYRQLRGALNELVAYASLAEVRIFLECFTPSSIEELGQVGRVDRQRLLARLSNRHPNLGHIDALGRACSTGRRKTAVARVQLVPGTGECWVNGRPAIEYFKRAHEMFRVADPLEASGSFGRWNAWCLVQGGGQSGQAGAIVQGLAKAITLLAPSMAGFLRPYIYRDPRVVERKKAGQPKARKKFTWVKR